MAVGWPKSGAPALVGMFKSAQRLSPFKIVLFVSEFFSQLFCTMALPPSRPEFGLAFTLCVGEAYIVNFVKLGAHQLGPGYEDNQGRPCAAVELSENGKLPY